MDGEIFCRIVANSETLKSFAALAFAMFNFCCLPETLHSRCLLSSTIWLLLYMNDLSMSGQLFYFNRNRRIFFYLFPLLLFVCNCAIVLSSVKISCSVRFHQHQHYIGKISKISSLGRWTDKDLRNFKIHSIFIVKVKR